MEKISSIIPSSTKSQVDMSKERPVRAGAPSFGRPISQATKTFEKVQKEEALMGSSNFNVTQRSAEQFKKDVHHTGIIDKITLSFKGNSERTQPVEQVIELDGAELLSGPAVESESISTEESDSSTTPSLDIYA